MKKGIAIFGLNGGGKSTLTHILSERTGFYEVDVEDYYFPEQKESRKRALEGASVIEQEYIGKLPFSMPRTKSEVESAILVDIKAHSRFIIAGVTMNWSNEILSYIDIAFWVQTPLEERLKRIQMREEKRFGARVLEGGDMYEQQKDFLVTVEKRDSIVVEESAKKFNCPVITINGTLPVEHNIEKIMSYIGGNQDGSKNIRSEKRDLSGN